MSAVFFCSLVKFGKLMVLFADRTYFVLSFFKVTIEWKNLKCQEIDQMSRKCRGKPCQGKLFIAFFTFGATTVFSSVTHACVLYF